MKLTQLSERCVNVPPNSYCECRLIPEQAEKDQLLIINELFNLMALQHYCVERLTANQTFVSPNRNKATVLIQNCLGKPVRILAPFTDPVDERAGKYIVVIHSSSRQNNDWKSTCIRALIVRCSHRAGST